MKVKIQAERVNVYYGSKHAIKDVSLDIERHSVTAFIGPSGCGKSTFLRCFNRMNDTVPGARVTGTILLDGKDVLKDMRPGALRRRIGMVFQKPNPFPKSIRDNVIYGPKVAGMKNKSQLEERCQVSLQKAALWDDVKDRLDDSAAGLSGGEQQRLCIARALAIHPEVLLMDEPTSALDPLATAAIEELIQELGRDYTVAIVTHNMQQARRVAHTTAFFYLGELIETAATATLFDTPRHQKTQAYLGGAFG